MMRGCSVGVASLLAVFAGGIASAQLRVVNWNVTLYSSGRQSIIANAVYGQVPAALPLAGQSMSPDVLIGQEFANTQASIDNFLAALNNAPGSPGDWAAAPLITSPDTTNAFFYRTSKLHFEAGVVISFATGSTSLPPRHTMRYDTRLVGYGDVPGTNISFYGTHMKAGSASTDQSRRLLEANKIRDNANGLDTNGEGTALPAGVMFMIGGDFNIQSSSQAAYVRMVGSEAINTGRFFDPIKSPGTWNNSGAFRFIHTQDPSTSGQGGMDDRHDQLLICGQLIDGVGFDYIGDANIPYSTTTWNDPNHSYRCWGNDGSTYDGSLAIATNQMVGPIIAQALVDDANSGGSSGGHLPVLLDLRVPARIASTETIDFGEVELNSVASADLNVYNAADVGLWTLSGVADLHYSLAATAGIEVPAGSFFDAPGGSQNTHAVTLDTSVAGEVSGEITIASDAPDQPVRTVLVSAVVVVSCPADFDGDGFLSGVDFDLYVQAFEAGDMAADFDQDGFLTGADFDLYVQAYEAGC